MKTKYALGATTLLAAAMAWSGGGLADGMPSRPASYYPGYNWSGLYIGGGLGWTDSDTRWLFRAPGFPATTNHFDGLQVSGHVGYQHQFGNLVLGVEGGVSDAPAQGWAGQPCGVGLAFNCQTKMKEVWTVGPRLGYAIDRWMVYGTGGWATTTVDSRIPTLVENTSHRQDGWFIGGGIEHALAKNIIVGLEYQHLEFNSVVHCITGTCTSGDDRTITPDSDVVRARLTFKFGRDDDYRPLK